MLLSSLQIGRSNTIFQVIPQITPNRFLKMCRCSSALFKYATQTKYVLWIIAQTG